MHKIAFVSIILIIGLFSLQLTLYGSGSSYFHSEPPVEVQPVRYSAPEFNNPSGPFDLDSTTEQRPVETFGTSYPI